MPDLSLVMLGAGSSSRFKLEAKKQWLRIEHTPLWLYATLNILKHIQVKKVVIVGDTEEISYMKRFCGDYCYVSGGDTRNQSLQNALQEIDTPWVLVSDVARACVPKEMLLRITGALKSELHSIVPYLPVSDTVVYEDFKIDRQKVKLIQTPQLSATKTLDQALQQEGSFTDESSAICAIGGKRAFVKGDFRANKLTFGDDLYILDTLPPPSSDMRVGNGFDVHTFEEGKKMWLGGVHVKASKGFKAHSDGDVALHALIDSFLGAVGAGDIGELFPDNDPAFKDADSKVLLKKVVRFLKNTGFVIINCDITIMAQSPKLSPYKEQMQKSIADILQIASINVNLKATTTEKLGFVGREEGIAAMASSALKYFDWKA